MTTMREKKRKMLKIILEKGIASKGEIYGSQSQYCYIAIKRLFLEGLIRKHNIMLLRTHLSKDRVKVVYSITPAGVAYLYRKEKVSQ